MEKNRWTARKPAALAAVFLMWAVLGQKVSALDKSPDREQYIRETVAHVDPDNALRIVVDWKTATPSDSRVEYRSVSSSQWSATPVFEEGTQTHTVTVAGLKENTRYFVRPVSNGIAGPVKVCFTGSLPTDIPSTELVLDKMGTGGNTNLIVTGVPRYGAVVAVNRAGNIVWYHMDKEGGDPGQFHVKDSQEDGRLYYQTTKAIKSVNYKGVEETALDIDALGEKTHHDFLITPEGNYMYLSQESVYRDDEWWCLDVVVERDSSGSVLWEWKCSDHMDRLGGFAVSNDHQRYEEGCGWDLTHANSVDLYSDAAGEKFVFISFRELSRVIKIDYQTKEIIWQLGEGLDFENTGSQPPFLKWFSCQHSARHLPNGSILLFDNGNERFSGQFFENKFSRCLVYYLNESSMTTWNPWVFRLQDCAEFAGNVVFSKDETFLILFPVDLSWRYSSLVRADAYEQCIWKTNFYYPSPKSTNMMAGLLEIESLYDLY